MTRSKLFPAKQLNYVLFFLFLTYAVVLLRTAWLNEDAYITMRTADNWVNGYGMRWNVADRVQTFTHPLWFLIISAFYFFTREAFYTLIFLCVAVSLAAFAMIAAHARNSRWGTLSPLLALILSNAFVDYSTAGMENPATHLLLAVFLWLFFERADDSFSDDRSVFWLGLFAGLLTTNRMDAILFVVPPLLLIFVKRPKLNTLKYILLGYLPFVAWEIFSIIYYGFPFPNTAYAKLYATASRADLIQSGLLYALNSWNWDPITLLTVSAGLGLALWQGAWKEKSAALGAALYLGYVIWIGADYMSGRFFSAALVVGAILLIRRLAQIKLTEGLAVAVLILFVGFASPTPTLLERSPDYSTASGRVDANGILDWRATVLTSASLQYAEKGTLQPDNEFKLDGLRFRETRREFVIYNNIGYMGYFAGPGVHILDYYALADPLLARLKPARLPSGHSAGHFSRDIPEGYVATLKQGSNAIEDPGLREYYDQLAVITQGPVFSWERFVAIWKMNTGQYDYLLEDYERKLDEAAAH